MLQCSVFELCLQYQIFLVLNLKFADLFKTSLPQTFLFWFLLETPYALNVSLFLLKQLSIFVSVFSVAAYTYYLIKNTEVAYKLYILAIWVQNLNHDTFAPRLLPLPNKALTIVVSGYFLQFLCVLILYKVCVKWLTLISNIMFLFFSLPAILLWLRILMQTLWTENRFCFPTMLNSIVSSKAILNSCSVSWKSEI